MSTNLAEAPRLAEQPLSQTDEQCPALYAVPDAIEQSAVATRPDFFIAADDIPELAFRRRRAATEAARLMAQNRQRLQSGEADAVPTPIDALGTARQVVEAKRQYGVDSPEFQERFTGLVLDSERLLAEAYSRNTAEYFGEVLQQFDHDREDYLSYGSSLSDVARSGLSPLAEPEEQDRRLNDYVEEPGTYAPIGAMIGRLGLHETIDRLVGPAATPTAERAPAGTGLHVTTFSECADFAIRDYKVNPKGSHSGYAPAVEKLMIRRVHFLDSADRLEEQVGVPGLYITRDVIQAVIADKSLAAQQPNRAKTELHGTQFVGVDDAGVMDVVRELDQKASQVHGKNIFMGEEVPEDHPKNYEDFAEQAEVRRRKLAPKPTELAEYLVALEEHKTPGGVAESLVDTWLKKTLLEVASSNPQLAEVMFDKETADGFVEVARLKAAGRHGEARQLQALVEKNAPEVSYCGAGSCGLEAAANTSEIHKARELGLQGELLHDTERACPGCSKKKIYYDHSGNKACTACGLTQINGAIKKSQE